MPIQLIDERRYPIEPRFGNDILPYWKFEHRATLGKNGRRFIVLLNNGVIYGKEYIEVPAIHVEEITTGEIKVLKKEEDELHAELANFAQEHGLCNIFPVLPKNSDNRPL